MLTYNQKAHVSSVLCFVLFFVWLVSQFGVFSLTWLFIIHVAGALCRRPSTEAGFVCLKNAGISTQWHVLSYFWSWCYGTANAMFSLSTWLLTAVNIFFRRTQHAIVCKTRRILSYNQHILLAFVLVNSWCTQVEALAEEFVMATVSPVLWALLYATKSPQNKRI